MLSMDGTLDPAPAGGTLTSRRAFAGQLLGAGAGALGLGGCATRAPIETPPAEMPDVIAPFSTAAPGGGRRWAGIRTRCAVIARRPVTPSFEIATGRSCTPRLMPQPPACVAWCASIP
jgi:hypothetical protein